MPRKRIRNRPPRPIGQSLSVLDLPKEIQDDFIDRAILASRKRGQCIEWTKAKDKDGYPLASPRQHTMMRLHRAICEWMYGRMESKAVAMHRCDNPSCLNPAHLTPGTNRDNQGDMTAKYRGRNGEKNGRAKLTESDVREIVRRRREGESAYNLADVFGVDFLAVQRIMRGEIWSHLNLDLSRTSAMNKRIKRGFRNIYSGPDEDLA